MQSPEFRRAWRLDWLAREVFELFPRCLRCGGRIERYEDADVRIFGRRVTHRGECPTAVSRPL